jgi:predicted HD phosphohydrolase
LQHHEIFQAYYWSDVPDVKNGRDQFKDSEHYDACIQFCEKWDQTAFDPAYDSLPIEFFMPMVENVIKREAYASPQHTEVKINKAKQAISSGYPDA